MTQTIVLIAETSSNFISALNKHHTTHCVRSGKQASELIRDQDPDVIVLDAISLGTNGERISTRLREQFPDKSLLHLHPDKKYLTHSDKHMVLTAPIAVRTLLSAIEMLTSRQEMPLLRCGDFVLDLERRILIARGREIALTPKQSALVEAFLTHPNETLERKWLMQNVWDTDYTGDTRTLNVHIRFVREAIEKNASKPQFIKTIRGIGYRFEIDINEKTDP